MELTDMTMIMTTQITTMMTTMMTTIATNKRTMTTGQYYTIGVCGLARIKKHLSPVLYRQVCLWSVETIRYILNNVE